MQPEVQLLPSNAYKTMKRQTETMKKLMLSLMLLASVCFTGMTQGVKLVPSADDSTRMDTVVFSTIVDADGDEAEEDLSVDLFSNNTHDINIDDEFRYLSIISIVTIVMIFGLPLFIVMLVLWFRYKNKQARYRLAAEALAQGKELPKEFLHQGYREPHQDILTKGIKNVFLGIGLGVFLWVLTGEESLAAIGFLMFCIGLGQVVIAKVTRPKDNDIDRR